MDDHASRAMAPLYLGVLLAISMVGPALGYILGSATTQIYVDFDRSSSSSSSSSHPSPSDANWLGAWWLGFLLASGVMFLLHIPFWFFPKSMAKEEEPISLRKTSSGDAKVELERNDKVDNAVEENRDRLVSSRNNNNNNNNSNNNQDLIAASNANKAQVDTKALLETGASNFLFYLQDFVAASIRLLMNPVFLLVILSYATLFAISAGICIREPFGCGTDCCAIECVCDFIDQSRTGVTF